MSKRPVLLVCCVLLCVCVFKMQFLVADEADWKSAKNGWDKALKLDPVAANEVVSRLSGAFCEEVEPDAAKIFVDILSKWSKNANESDSGRQLVDSIVNVLSRFSTEEGIVKLFSDVKSSRQDLWVRVTVFKGLLNSRYSAVSEIVLSEFQKFDEKSLKIMAMNYFGDNRIEKAIDVLLEVLQKTTEWDMTLAAARALKNFNQDRVIKALIDVRGKQTGRTGYELQEIIDGMIGTAKAPGSGPAPVAGASSVTYFGKPVVSKRIIFIVDISGSMSEAASSGLAQNAVESGKETGGQGISAPPNTSQKVLNELAKLRDQNSQRAVANKMDAVKKELIKTILALPHDAFFTIIFYSQGPSAWKDELCKAVPQNKIDAIDAVEKQSPNAQTNIYDSIEMALKMSVKEKKAQKNNDKSGTAVLIEGSDGADTIYLLTDGIPNVGKIPDPAGILKAVTELNKTRMIQINTIGVGQALDEDFLRKLAEQNWGVYIKADSQF